MRRIEDFTQKLELQDHVKSDLCQHFCNQPQVDFDSSANHELLSGELKVSCVQLDGHADVYCSVWTGTDSEPERVKNCKGRSFAMDARIRLDSLKSSCSSPTPRCTMDKKNNWDGEESENKQTALDSVEILDVDDDEHDEESWLYEPTKTQLFVQKESALRWCRHVLDNPTPEMDAACRVLMNKLDPKSRCYFYRRTAASSHVLSVSAGSSSDSTSLNDSDSYDHNGPNISRDSFTTSYRLQDITDVHIMAQLQEASLRQDFVSTPAATSFRKNPDMFPSHFNTSAENLEFSPQNDAKPELPLVNSSHFQPPTSPTKQGCQSPKMPRLHQQVTQYKLLKLAQNQASPSRARSPLRTSLRSLQAVRNSRSLETDDCPSAGQTSHPLSGGSSTRIRSCWGSSSPTSSPLNSSSLMTSMRDSSLRITAMKKLQRSQSLSPCRIPHPAKGCLSVQGRVFASPERPTTAAWGQHLPAIQL